MFWTVELGGRRGHGTSQAWLGWTLGAAAIAVVALLVLVLAVSSSASKTASALPNGNLANQRDLGGAIDSLSVAKLEVVWTDPFAGQSAYSSYTATPVVSDGVIYSQDLASNVEAIDLKTGRVLWRTSFETRDEGPNGVTVAAGRVYGATPTMAFALDQRTGKQIWSATLTHGKTAGIDMAPGYHDGIVYVSTVPVTAKTQYAGNDVGVLYALNARTGRTLWTFRTIAPSVAAHGAAAGAGDDGGASGGGLLYTPAFDASGSMYVGVGNPTPFPGTSQAPWGSSRPGPNLYSDSIVKLNARTGALEWYYQLTPHDLYGWGLQDPPILVSSGGRGLVLAAGKAGIVIALDASTGALVWQRAVGVHDGHDHDGVYAMKGEYTKLKTPATIEPGLLGGVIAPMSTNGTDLFVPVVNHRATLASPFEVAEDSSRPTGELVALSVRTGAPAWNIALTGAPFGPTTVVNDLVFATSIEGEGYAFDTTTGEERWREPLPAGANAGLTASGSMLLVPVGVDTTPGKTPELIAYRLMGSK